MNRYAHHKYTWTKPYSGSVRHSWELIGSKGGVQFHVTVSKEYGDCAGLEFHYLTPPDYMRDTAPSQVHCWLLKTHCWHDGTSLYASENLWPIIKVYLQNHNHDAIFLLLESEADNRFGYKCEEVDDD